MAKRGFNVSSKGSTLSFADGTGALYDAALRYSDYAIREEADGEREVDEALPLALAAHEESRHREYPLDPERLPSRRAG